MFRHRSKYKSVLEMFDKYGARGMLLHPHTRAGEYVTVICIDPMGDPRAPIFEGDPPRYKPALVASTDQGEQVFIFDPSQIVFLP